MHIKRSKPVGRTWKANKTEKKKNIGSFSKEKTSSQQEIGKKDCNEDKRDKEGGIKDRSEKDSFKVKVTKFKDNC